MRNIWKYALCIAAMFQCACSKSDVANPDYAADDDYRIINILAAADDTRVHFGEKEGNDYPVLWDADDQIHVTINAQDTGSGNKFISSHETTVSDDGRTASFAVKLLNTKQPDKYVYYAYTPVDRAYLTNGSTHNGGYYANPENDRVRLWIPTVQTPTATAVDRYAHILYGVSQDCGSYDVDPTLHFSHWTAYGKLALTNLALDDGDAVKTVTLTAADGKYLTGGFVHRTLTGATEDISSTHSTELQITTSATENILFGCYAGIEGVNDLSGTSLKITVITENLVTFTRELDLTGKTLKFEAGKISAFAVDMASADKVSPVVGKKLVAYIDFGYEANGAAPWNNYTAPKSGTKITLNDEDGQVTAVSLEVSENFASAWSGATSEPNHPIVSNGIEWPLAAWRDALVISGTAGKGNTKASSVKLSGLDAAKTYKLALLAVRYNGGKDARITQFTVTGAETSEAKQIKTGLKTDAANYGSWENVPFDNFSAVYTGIAPDADGCITVSVVGIDTESAAEGHLNAMYIAEE
ncbi:MAG: hypothetical protein J6K28_06050 [Alistipes sp.]|nr:hypothetical protein [Alistipes sp.]